MIKKITFIAILFLFTQISFGQEKYIQIEMVDQSPNYDFVGYPSYYYDMPFGATDYSNDVGLNTILTGNNVIAYDYIESLPNVSENGYANWTLVICDNCDNNQLAAELNAYSSVIRNAYPLDDGLAHNQLYLGIVDVNVGTVTGTNNGIVTTNDAGLNALFTTYNVYFYEQYYPSFTDPYLLSVYTLLCDCDVNLLMTDMEAYSSVINYVERMGLGSQMLLSVSPETAFTDVVLYPNPVKNTLHISNTTHIKSLEIYSIQGQVMLTQKSQFETVDMSQLQSGLYFVKLTDAANRSKTIKIAKN